MKVKLCKAPDGTFSGQFFLATQCRSSACYYFYLATIIWSTENGFSEIHFSILAKGVRSRHSWRLGVERVIHGPSPQARTLNCQPACPARGFGPLCLAVWESKTKVCGCLSYKSARHFSCIILSAHNPDWSPHFVNPTRVRIAWTQPEPAFWSARSIPTENATSALLNSSLFLLGLTLTPVLARWELLSVGPSPEFQGLDWSQHKTFSRAFFYLYSNNMCSRTISQDWTDVTKH